MPISALPEAPSQSDPANFATEADAFVAALDTFRTDANALEVTVNAAEAAVAADAAIVSAAALVAADSAGLVAQSTSTIAFAAGTATIHFTAPKTLLATMPRRVAIIQLPDTSIRMLGDIATTDGSDDITVTVDTLVGPGTGSYSDWQIVDASFYVEGAAAADIWEGTSDAVSVTPAAMTEAQATVALTPGSSVTPDLSTGRRFSLAPTGSFTLAAPTNAHPGDDIEIEITHGASSIVMAVNAAWVRQNGLGVLSVTSGYKDLIVARVLTVDGSDVATRVVYQVIRRPVTA